MQAQPFIPDDDYCAYCHAPAAGPCAECGALCCGDCVELVMQLTSERAVCVSCIAKRRPRGAPRAWRWIGIGFVVLVAACLLLYRAA
jgi:hypothetical protein